MKIITSNCEKEFVYESILKGRRLDGRSPFDGRDIEIIFGKDDGSCIVVQGNTRVLAVVTCETTSPKASRPAEGSLYVNLDISPMSAPNVRTGRVSDEAIEATRLLERCVRDSKCIDLESLCIVSGLKVWCVRVNIQILNNDGNFIECASIACISALAHFKRPDVTVIGTDVTVHSPDDHNPIPLTLHHMPVIVNLAIYDEGLVILVDPLEMEERISSGRVIIGINAHQELCSWHLSGTLMLTKEIIIQCMNIAVKRAQTTTQIIRSALDADKYKKSTNQPTGFVSLMQTGTLLGQRHTIFRTEVLQEENRIGDTIEAEISDDESAQLEMTVSEASVKNKVRQFLREPQVAVFEGGESRWQLKAEESDEESDEESSDETEEVQKGDNDQKPIIKTEKSDVVTLSDSESEEEKETKHFLKSHQVDIKDKKTAAVRGWYSKDPFQ